MIYDCLFYFNRRSRKGSDHVEKTDYPHRPCISIRAPARGATDLPYVLGLLTDISIRAPARGATYSV